MIFPLNRWQTPAHALMLGGMLGLAGEAAATDPVLPEFQVNTTSSGDQRNPDIAVFPNGRFIVVFEDHSNRGADTSEGGIRARTFQQDGTPVGPDFAVNSSTTGPQRNPAVSVNSQFETLIVWEDHSQSIGDTNGAAIRGRRFDAFGVPRSNDFVINTITTGDQLNPDIHTLMSFYLVAWEDHSRSPDHPGGSSIRTQAFRGDGSFYFSETLINDGDGTDHSSPTITASDETEYHVLAAVDGSNFFSRPPEDIRREIHGRGVSIAGDPTSGFDPEIYIEGLNLDNPQSADFLDDRQNTWAAIVFEQSDPAGLDGNGMDIGLRIYGPGSGAGPFLVNQHRPGDQRNPAITARPLGGYFIAFEDHSGEYGEGSVILVQEVSRLGEIVGAPFSLSAVTTGNQTRPALTPAGLSGFTAAFEDDSGAGTDTSGMAIRARGFDLVDNPPRIVSINPLAPIQSPTSADEFTFRVLFNEPVENSDTAGWLVQGILGGNPNNFSRHVGITSPTITDITVRGGELQHHDGVVELVLPDTHSIVDSSGQRMENATPLEASITTMLMDNTDPASTLTVPSEVLQGAEFTFTVEFSEDIVGFDPEDLTYSNLGSVELAPGASNPYTVIARALTVGPVEIAIPAGIVTDVAGNPNEDHYALSFQALRSATLTVDREGLGSGTITSQPAGVDCGSDCIGVFAPDTDVTLTAVPAAGSRFERWTSGPCVNSTQTDCVIDLASNASAQARFVLDEPPEGRVVASTLPGARSGYVGGPVLTAFMTVISRRTTPAQACRIQAPDGAPVILDVDQMDIFDEIIPGRRNAAFDLAAGEAINLILAMSPTSATGDSGYTFRPQISCDNATLGSVDGVNTIQLSIGDAPIPDILSIGATLSGDGVIRIPVSGNRISFMSAAAVNIGAGDGSAGADEATVTVSADTGSAALPLTLEVCETGSGGACLSPRSASVTTVFRANEVRTFAVFARIGEGQYIAFNPALSRVYMRFHDATGALRSAFSAAVSSPID